MAIYAKFNERAQRVLSVAQKEAQAMRHPYVGTEHLLLALVAEGRSNQAIAEALTLSVYTVQAHLRSIFGKIGVASRAAAARYAWEHGLTAAA